MSNCKKGRDTDQEIGLNSTCGLSTFLSSDQSFFFDFFQLCRRKVITFSHLIYTDLILFLAIVLLKTQMYGNCLNILKFDRLLIASKSVLILLFVLQ